MKNGDNKCIVVLLLQIHYHAENSFPIYSSWKGENNFQFFLTGKSKDIFHKFRKLRAKSKMI